MKEQNEAAETNKTASVKAVEIERMVSLFRAGSVGDSHAPVTRFDIAQEISDEISMKEARQLYDEQGKTLCDALFSSLPGGTIDALIRNLLERRASLFRISFEG